MKKLTIILFALVILFACKKKSSTPAQDPVNNQQTVVQPADTFKRITKTFSIKVKSTYYWDVMIAIKDKDDKGPVLLWDSTYSYHNYKMTIITGSTKCRYFYYSFLADDRGILPTGGSATVTINGSVHKIYPDSVRSVYETIDLYK